MTSVTSIQVILLNPHWITLTIFVLQSAQDRAATAERTASATLAVLAQPTKASLRTRAAPARTNRSSNVSVKWTSFLLFGSVLQNFNLSISLARYLILFDPLSVCNMGKICSLRSIKNSKDFNRFIWNCECVIYYSCNSACTFVNKCFFITPKMLSRFCHY